MKSYILSRDLAVRLHLHLSDSHYALVNSLQPVQQARWYGDATIDIVLSFGELWSLLTL
jgi:hypothetical protein